jgi:hypothetical protein
MRRFRCGSTSQFSEALDKSFNKNLSATDGFYFCAANNISPIPGKSGNPLNRQSLARNTEVIAFVRKVPPRVAKKMWAVYLY